MKRAATHALLVLSLTLALAACNAPSSIEAAAADPALTARIEAGKELFMGGSCKKCHGETAEGGGKGPNLTDDEWVQGDGSLEAIRATILDGVAKESIEGSEFKRAMKARGGKMELDDEGVDAVAAYVWSLTNAQ